MKNSYLFFSISGSVVLESFASKDLSSSCSLTTAFSMTREEEDDGFVVSMSRNGKEDEEGLELKLSSKAWASLMNFQWLPPKKSIGITSALALL